MTWIGYTASAVSFLVNIGTIVLTERACRRASQAHRTAMDALARVTAKARIAGPLWPPTTDGDQTPGG